MADQGQQRYRVIERLASGGMAEVYLAESAGLEGFKKRVAIKRVLPHLSEKKRFIAMFLDEARLSAHLNHSNVAQVFDIGVGDNTYFIVMEYVDGSDLKQLINYLRENNRAFPVEAAIYVSGKICEGLAYAHELTDADGTSIEAVHRDVSPPNVLISKHGEIKIVDFGLAKASTQLEKSEAGIIKGKFSYLAPEAANGLEVDARADIFAVGIMLWEMLAGRRLFQGKTDFETVRLVQASEVPPIGQLNQDAADPHLQGILNRALARDRDRRYASARELGRDLTRLLYRLGKPVDAFDVAELIRGAMGGRGRRVGDASAIIESLIAETLLEFTSLRDKDKSQSASTPSGRPAAEPLDIGEFAAGARAAHDQRKAAMLVKNSLPASAMLEGNLAALEGPEEGNLAALEDPGSTQQRRAVALGAALGKDAGPSLAAEISEEIPSRKPSSAGAGAEPRSFSPSKSSLAVKALLLVIIAAGTAAAVYFSGML